MAQIDIMSYNMSTTLFHGDYASHCINNIAFFIIFKLFNLFCCTSMNYFCFPCTLWLMECYLNLNININFEKGVWCGCVNYVVIKTLMYRFVRNARLAHWVMYIHIYIFCPSRCWLVHPKIVHNFEGMFTQSSCKSIIINVFCLPWTLNWISILLFPHGKFVKSPMIFIVPWCVL